ncbi:MAG: phenylalanine--tRNA ligase subunit beta [Gammaproteobacteria bacterium]|nr:phenylalanine--tRNA ligase subunit beta [Gammaproteobacteria bacterium]MDX2459962.1 phenylalanine--tRNA ligase subunit beta [Gammaproteobacteria bacterium]
MKVSEQWLREWADAPVDTDTLLDQLTSAGLTVDSAEPLAAPMDKVVVAEVLEVSAHPEADRLRVCSVDVGGGETLTVVCGAPNVHQGMRAPMALVGARLADGHKIRRSKIRGVESQGMLCSATEIGLGEDADGIVSLDPQAPIGKPLSEYLRLDDVIIDIELTPNRGDCLGMSGVAREIGVANKIPLQGPELQPVAAEIDDRFAVHLDTPEHCPRYVGRVIRDIDPAARTPVWMQERLRRCGVRPISPVVDITNYVMLELGQPMHAFDLDSLDSAIHVRLAADGERLTLLDGNEVALTAGSLVIADARRAVALAGIMGGLDTAVTDESRNIFLECAWFAPKTIALEARRLGLHTDASHRFERHASSVGQMAATERATELLMAVVGGRAGPLVDTCVKEALPSQPTISLRSARIERVLGMPVADATVVDILERLGMGVVAAGGQWQVTPPAFRADISMETDLIEELARIIGYDAIPSHAPRADLLMFTREEARISDAAVRAVLVQRGYQEAITYSFVDAGDQAQLDPGQPPLPLANPITSDMAVMRTSLWPGLMQALEHNLNRQQPRVRLFELGLRFRQLDGELLQQAVIAGVAAGPVFPEQWGAKTTDGDFHDLKSDVEALLALAGDSAELRYTPAGHGALHPGQSARIERSGALVGYLGALHPAVSRERKLALPVYLFELDLDSVQAGHRAAFKALSKFPTVRRDVSLVVDESVTAQAIRHCVGQVGIHVLENLELFDVYRGEGIDSGQKSLSLGLTFQDSSRTLTDAEVDQGVDQIVASLRTKFGAILRG